MVPVPDRDECLFLDVRAMRHCTTRDTHPVYASDARKQAPHHLVAWGARGVGTAAACDRGPI
jgi:hypothetical protein